MEYIHIKNLDKYNPGYTDRNLIWCKIYFSMLNSSYEVDNIDDVDKWRLVALIMLELQMKKPVPYDEKWLAKRISNNKRPISLSIKMLHNFLDVVTDSLPREEKSREEKSSVTTQIQPIIEDLNIVCSSSYRLKNNKTCMLIRARLNEGFCLEDFKMVHRKKHVQWAGTEYAKYLRPETLYGTKFESYLNELEHKKPLQARTDL